MFRLVTLLIIISTCLNLNAQENFGCGTMDVLERQIQQDPSILNRMEYQERLVNEFIHNGGQQRSNVITTIPVVFHIIHLIGQPIGVGENIPDSRIFAQINQLNDDFRKLNADAGDIWSAFQNLQADAEIEFCLAERDPSGHSTNGINRYSAYKNSWSITEIENQIKPSTIWNRDQYLNIWVVNFSDRRLLGYAQFPGLPASTDGIVLRYTTLGSLSSPSPPSQSPLDAFLRGRIATHEVGHWLNLRHIWGDENCGNDFVDDTPLHNSSNAYCPLYPHYSTCAGQDIEMVQNYMDYTDDICKNTFTIGQKQRMQSTLQLFRLSLTNSLGCEPAEDNPVDDEDECRESFEPNNGASVNLPLATVNTNLTSQISTSIDNDWYRFANLFSAKNIRIDLTNLPANYGVKLYRGSTLLETSNISRVIVYNSSQVRSDWYVHVYGINGAFSNSRCYTLRISLSNKPFDDDGEDEDNDNFRLPVTQLAFKMYPNPVADELNIDLNMVQGKDTKVTVRDIMGKIRLEEKNNFFQNRGHFRFNLSQLPTGVYFVSVENDGKSNTQKLTVIH